MCVSQPKAPKPITPPKVLPTATELDEPEAIRKRRPGSSDLDSLRIPLNPTSLPKQPRIGL